MMKNESIIYFGKCVFGLFLVLGSICLFGNFLTKNDEFAIAGFFLLIYGTVVNLALVFALLVYGIVEKKPTKVLHTIRWDYLYQYSGCHYVYLHRNQFRFDLIFFGAFFRPPFPLFCSIAFPKFTKRAPLRSGRLQFNGQNILLYEF